MLFFGNRFDWRYVKKLLPLLGGAAYGFPAPDTQTLQAAAISATTAVNRTKYSVAIMIDDENAVKKLCK